MSKQKNAKKPAARKTAAGKKKTITPHRQTAAKPAKKSGAGKQTKKPGNAGQKSKTVEKENFPHFRKYKKSNHPALIVGEQKGKKTDNQGKERETDEYIIPKQMRLILSNFFSDCFCSANKSIGFRDELNTI